MRKIFWITVTVLALYGTLALSMLFSGLDHWYWDVMIASAVITALGVTIIGTFYLFYRMFRKAIKVIME